MNHRILKTAFLFLFAVCCLPGAFAQLGKITVDLEKDKPEKFKTKVLKSEKTGDKKFTKPRRFVQNTVTHYNYYFNANNRLNEVIEKARIANHDDYSVLLPFYGYSLKNTSAQKSDLDSVIYKATAGILLHDLRSDWVDNLYLLIGRAYFLRNDLDSAAMTFQFINYNLFPRKKNDDDSRIVGTNNNEEGGNTVTSIANKEKHDIATKIFSRPPSRNDALVWQIRTLTETNEYYDAAGLINTLQNDPNFPSRLKPDLEEVYAYWFYKQSMYDSAAFHLQKALSNAEDKQDKARWEFLLAQLYEKTKDYGNAQEYYSKSMHHTTDPLMDIYANLNSAKLYKNKDSKAIENSISTLAKMAKRDKYEGYRDIVYYSAGQLALEVPDTAQAEFYLKKSIFYNETNVAFKNKAFLTLAEINFKRKNYRNAFAYYDSLKSGDTTLDLAKIQERRSSLEKIVEKMNIVEREDSLQKIAGMSPADREAFIKKILKKVRKENGIKEDDASKPNPSSVFGTNPNPNLPADIFSNNDGKGDWYFYNASMKSRGFTEFQTKWGKRVNVDNWRRRTAIDAVLNTGKSDLNSKAIIPGADPNSASAGELSYETLLNNIPLTTEKLGISNSLVAGSLYSLGKLYQGDLEDYEQAVNTYETSLQRFPDSLYGGELYLNLSYSYQKLGNQTKANYYKNLLTTKFKDSKFSQYALNPQSASTNTKTLEATKKYENIYNLFIEGKFDEALAQKKSADSLYGNNYWSPQLLYIEAMYYVRQRQDSLATVVLNQIITTYPSTPLKARAATMLDVLSRRKDIEGYLTNLKVERANDSVAVVTNNPPVNNKPVIIQQINQPQNVTRPKDSIKISLPPKIIGTTNPSFSFDANASQNVVMVLDKVDPVYVSETRNAFTRYNRSNFPNDNITIVKDTVDKDRTVLIFSQFQNADAAITYATKIKKDALTEVSWLPVAKYSFLIISDANFAALKLNKDLKGYTNILKASFPGKF